MFTIIIINPTWILAMAAAVTACFTMLKFFLDVFMVYEKKHENQEHKLSQGTSNPDEHPKKKAWMELRNLKFYRRSSMRKVFREAKRLSSKMTEDGFNPTLIVFIGRGGSIFGSLISYNLKNVPIFCVDREYANHTVSTVFPINYIPKKHLESILLVAGEAHSGVTINYFKELLENLNNQATIKTCVFFKQSCCDAHIDYVGYEEKDFVLMPWQDKTFLRQNLLPSVKSNES